MNEPEPDVQDVPATSSDERMHELSRDCWCNPRVETVEGRPHVRHTKPEAEA